MISPLEIINSREEIKTGKIWWIKLTSNLFCTQCRSSLLFLVLINLHFMILFSPIQNNFGSQGTCKPWTPIPTGASRHRLSSRLKSYYEDRQTTTWPMTYTSPTRKQTWEIFRKSSAQDPKKFFFQEIFLIWSLLWHWILARSWEISSQKCDFKGSRILKNPKFSGALPLAPIGGLTAPPNPQLICSFATLSRCDASHYSSAAVVSNFIFKFKFRKFF